MFRLRTILPSDVLQTLYNGLIMSHFLLLSINMGINRKKLDTNFTCCKRKRLGLLAIVITLLIPSLSLKKYTWLKLLICLASQCRNFIIN